MSNFKTNFRRVVFQIIYDNYSINNNGNNTSSRRNNNSLLNVKKYGVKG